MITKYTLSYEVELLAIPVGGDGCAGCKFETMHNCDDLRSLIKLPNCSGRFRTDGENVIFIEKQQ